MTIPFPFPVYGTVKYLGTGVAVVGATVEAVDVTNNQGTGSCVTIAGGKYVINLQRHATNGDTVKVSCSYGGASAETTFTLVVSIPGKVIDLLLPPLLVPGLHPGGMARVMGVSCEC